MHALMHLNKASSRHMSDTKLLTRAIWHTVVIVTGGASGSMLNSNLLISMARATTASDRAN